MIYILTTVHVLAWFDMLHCLATVWTKPVSIRELPTVHHSSTPELVVPVSPESVSWLGSSLSCVFTPFEFVSSNSVGSMEVEREAVSLRHALPSSNNAL